MPRQSGITRVVSSAQNLNHLIQQAFSSQSAFIYFEDTGINVIFQGCSCFFPCGHLYEFKLY